jgi:hypothetical protein
MIFYISLLLFFFFLLSRKTIKANSCLNDLGWVAELELVSEVSGVGGLGRRRQPLVTGVGVLQFNLLSWIVLCQVLEGQCQWAVEVSWAVEYGNLGAECHVTRTVFIYLFILLMLHTICVMRVHKKI